MFFVGEETLAHKLLVFSLLDSSTLVSYYILYYVLLLFNQAPSVSLGCHFYFLVLFLMLLKRLPARDG